MNVFVPISSSYTGADGAMIAIGAAKLADVGGSAAAVLEPLWQMSQAAFAGEATVELVDGQAQVKARISQDVAAAKVGTKVYRGFSLAILKGGDGSIRCARIALCDTPDAVTKGTGGEFLKLSRRISTMKSVLIQPGAVRLAVREARDRRSEELRLGKANPVPGGDNLPYRGDRGQWQGTGVTAGGAGKDRAPFGQDEGTDRCQAEIRAALARPFAEAGGLVTMLRSRTEGPGPEAPAKPYPFLPMNLV
jgi:hypothetical protein